MNCKENSNRSKWKDEALASALRQERPTARFCFSRDKNGNPLLAGLITLALIAASPMSLARSSKTSSQINIQILAKNRAIRHTESYKRIHRLCSKAFDPEIFLYAAASTQETLRLFLGDIQLYKKKIQNRSGVSDRLHQDIQADPFFLATKDCGYSEAQSTRLFLSLLIMDGLGRGLVLVAATRLAISAFLNFQTVSRLQKVTSLLASASLSAISALGVWIYFDDEKSTDPESQIVSLSTLRTQLQESLGHGLAPDFQVQLIEEYRRTLAELESQLQSLEAGTPEYARTYVQREERARQLEQLLAEAQL